MNTLRQTLKQYFGLFNAMSPSQRATLVVVPLLVAGALAFLAFGGSASSYVALSWGKVFTTDELTRAEQTLIDQGLRDFRRDGQRLLVPAAEADRYNAALLDGGTLPSNWGEERERQLKDANIFTSDRNAQERRDIALIKELNRIIGALPDIEFANVVWSASKTGRWSRQDQKVKATINVRPRPGRELTHERVQALRAAVTNMVPDLSSADVVVWDLSTGRAFAPEDEGDPLNGKLLRRIREFEREYESKISGNLAHIPGVVVTVHVDVENLKRSVERTQTLDPRTSVPVVQTGRTRNETYREPPRSELGVVNNAPHSLATAPDRDTQRTTTETSSESVSVPSFTISDREFIAAMPKAVQVAIKIPEDYYQLIAAKRGAAEGTTDAAKAEYRKAIDAIRVEEEKKARSTAAILIPAGSPATAVEVSSFVSVTVPEVPVAASVTETVGNAVSRWGSAAALGLFALWVLWMLKRSMPKLPGVEPDAPEAAVMKAAEPETQTEPDEVQEQLTRRDALQTMVRDDPKAAAAVIGRWIRAASG